MSKRSKSTRERKAQDREDKKLIKEHNTEIHKNDRKERKK
jgi:hypothetical protein